ncbi:hypothetical protein VNO77_42170 [Canavalia gladiata]|uniref:PetM of cytochrome b6/f complex subunit 7 n=1 Tax=Canavalia gladiata TaxID=3824 RepID=A0AAN9PQS1_CANGL
MCCSSNFFTWNFDALHVHKHLNLVIVVLIQISLFLTWVVNRLFNLVDQQLSPNHLSKIVGHIMKKLSLFLSTNHIPTLSFSFSLPTCKLSTSRTTSLDIQKLFQLNHPKGCAATPTTIHVVASSCVGSRRGKKSNNVQFMRGLNSYGGLKTQNNVTSLGFTVGKGRDGGANSSTCNAAAGEIFQIAAIMNGLVLIGVAVGFVLLRLEASLEEAE